ncbi:MAG: ATP synthase epsilon chain, sodium ion specific [candidate division BRC1 bacterium ADurb.BinA364]|nr:MAG: ATP synthase epsilon chain, sodium ion specific [candidate division BRC1 bacterium ADurb.BinA364]
MAEFRLQIITQERTLFDRPVASIIAPGGLGYLGVLARHAPLASTLGQGKLTVRQADGAEFVFLVSGGFLEVSNNSACVLADSLQILSAPPGEAFDNSGESA